MAHNTTTKTAQLKLRASFIMTSEDIELLEALPDNLPDTKLTDKQKKLVDTLYNKYIHRNQVFYGWGTDLYKLEQKEKWPSGPRVKEHEAKRMILGWLCFYSKDKAILEGEKALSFLLTELTCREADQILISKAYEVI